MSTYSADISVKVVGLASLTSLENRVAKLQSRFTELNEAAAGITAPFKAHIEALQTLNTLLQANGRLLNQQAAAVQRMERAQSGGSGRGTGDIGLLREQQAGWKQQIDLLRQRAARLNENTAITERLLAAEKQLLGETAGNVRLGKEQIKNARSLVVEREREAAAAAKVAAADQRIAADAQRAAARQRDQAARAEAQTPAGRLDTARREVLSGGSGQIRGIERTITTIQQLDKAVSALGATFTNLDKNGRGATGDTFGVLKKKADDFFQSLVKGEGYLAKTTAGLQEQAAAFRTLAANTDFASDKFRTYIQGAQAASDKGLRSQMAELKALQEMYEGTDGRGTSIEGNRMGMGALAALRQDMPETLAGLKLYQQELERISQLINPQSPGASGLAQEINRIADSMSRLNAQQNDLDRAARGLPPQAVADAEEAQARALRESVAAQAELTRLAHDEATARAKSQAALRNLEQTRSNEARQRLAEAVDAKRNPVQEVVRRNTAGASPVVPFGPGNYMGEAQFNNAKKWEGQAAAKAQAAEAQRAAAAAALRKQAAATVTEYRLQVALAETLAASIKKQKDATTAKYLELRKITTEEKIQAKLSQYKAEKQRRDAAKEKEKQSDNRAESMMLGVGFPLMFGAGPASIAGSAVGSLPFFGSGFGGQIFMGALGAMVDNFATAAQTTAASLRDPIASFEELKTAGMFADREQERLIARLIELGQVSGAAAEIQGQVIRKIGNSGLSDMQALDETTVRLSKAWAELNIQMQALAAGPLAEILDLAARALGRQTAANRIDALQGDLAPEQRKQLDARIKEELRKPVAGSGIPKWLLDGGDAKAESIVTLPTSTLEKLYKEFEGKRPAVPVKLNADNRLKEATAGLEKAERAEALRRQGVQLERSQQDARLQIEDQVRGFRQRAADLERANIDLRRSVEDEIFRKRQDLARIESDNAREQARLATERLDMQLGGMKVSGNVPGQDIANGLLSAVQQYVKTRADAEADFQQKERNFKIEMVELQKASDRFSFEVARKVADMQRQAVEYNRDVERAILSAERTIYDLQIAAADYRVAKAKEAIAIEVQAGQQIQQTQQLTSQVQAGGATGPTWKISQREMALQMGRHGFRWNTGMGGHKTPDHDNQAMDFGYWGGNNYVEMTKKWEAAIRATGAPFAQGLIGPTSDWYGHGEGRKKGNTHLHGPSPGNQVTINQALADLLKNGLGGGTPAARPAAAAAAAPAAAVPSATPRPVSIDASMTALSGLRAPAVAGVGDLMKISAALDTNIAKAKQIGLELAKAFSAMTKEGAAQAMEQQVTATIDQLNAPLDQLLKTQQDQLAYEREYAGLIAEGVTPALAEQLVKIQQQTAEQLRQYEVTQGMADALKLKLEGEGKWTEELQRQYDLLKAQKGIIEGKGAQAAAVATQDAPGKKVRDHVTRLQGELADTDAMIVSLAGTIEGELGGAMSNALMSITQGTITAQQAFSQMFAAIGEAFIAMATQMIAKALIMKVLGIIGGAAGGGMFGGGDADPLGAGGKFWTRAAGGPVEGGSSYLVGEQGPELFTPGSSGSITSNADMGGAMGRFRPVSGGSAADGGEAGAAGGGTSNGSVAISYNVTEINSMRFVSETQFQQGMAEAAKRGAEGGRAKVMGDLRNKRSSRARVGI